MTRLELNIENNTVVDEETLELETGSIPVRIRKKTFGASGKAKKRCTLSGEGNLFKFKLIKLTKLILLRLGFLFFNIKISTCIEYFYPNYPRNGLV